VGIYWKATAMCAVIVRARRYTEARAGGCVVSHLVGQLWFGVTATRSEFGFHPGHAVRGLLSIVSFRASLPIGNRLGICSVLARLPFGGKLCQVARSLTLRSFTIPDTLVDWDKLVAVPAHRAAPRLSAVFSCAATMQATYKFGWQRPIATLLPMPLVSFATVRTTSTA
jgi:hypothetical protein